MLSRIIKLKRYLSAASAIMLMVTAMTLSRPNVAQAAECYRNCYGCNNCDPYLYLIYCCDVCNGNIECGCTWFSVGC